MRAWTPTARRGGAAGLSTLLRREEWIDSEGERLRSILGNGLSDPDPVCRWTAANVLPLLERDPFTALGLIRERLRGEEDFEVGATLVAQLRHFVAEYPDLVDEILYDASFEAWRRPFDDEDSQADYAFADGFVMIVLHLALVVGTPHARSMARSWFEEPWESRMCERAIILLRDFLARGDAEVRSSAFALLLLAAEAAEQVCSAVAPAAEEVTRANQVMESICSTVHLASGAFREQGDQNVPPPRGYLESALPFVQRFLACREPEMVHDIVETLAHLASQGPGPVLLCLRDVVEQTEGETYAYLAEEATTSLCARYLSEFWEDIVGDDDLLTALREVLSAFVLAGWASAIELSRRLGDAFR